jgi:hypothetical protein
VTFVQRFGSALSAYAHFHCCVIDGVFARGDDGQIHLAKRGQPTFADIAAGLQHTS